MTWDPAFQREKTAIMVACAWRHGGRTSKPLRLWTSGSSLAFSGEHVGKRSLRVDSRGWRCLIRMRFKWWKPHGSSSACLCCFPFPLPFWVFHIDSLPFSPPPPPLSFSLPLSLAEPAVHRTVRCLDIFQCQAGASRWAQHCCLWWQQRASHVTSYLNKTVTDLSVAWTPDKFNTIKNPAVHTCISRQSGRNERHAKW